MLLACGLLPFRVMGSTAELRLRWSSYESTLLLSVCDMWDAGALTDVTLFAEGRTIKAHKVVLSSCSGYFKEVLQVINNLALFSSFHFSFWSNYLISLLFQECDFCSTPNHSASLCLLPRSLGCD